MAAEEINHRRRSLLSAAAMTIAAAQFVAAGSGDAQATVGQAPF
jgi:hypothetical protein